LARQGDSSSVLRSIVAGRLWLTRGRGLWDLVYSEEHDDLGAARRRESHLKRMKSRRVIEQLIDSQDQDERAKDFGA